ncbi:unnamed protein product [Brassica rapa subsp. trilocularis]
MKLGSCFLFISWFAMKQYNEAEALKLPDEGAFE